MFDEVQIIPPCTWRFKFSSFISSRFMDDWIDVKVLLAEFREATDELNDVTILFVEARDDTATATVELSDVTDEFINASNFLIPGSTICSLISSLSLSSSVLLYIVFTIKFCEYMLLPNEVCTCNQKRNLINFTQEHLIYL